MTTKNKTDDIVATAKKMQQDQKKKQEKKKKAAAAKKKKKTSEKNSKNTTSHTTQPPSNDVNISQSNETTFQLQQQIIGLQQRIQQLSHPETLTKNEIWKHLKDNMGNIIEPFVKKKLQYFFSDDEGKAGNHSYARSHFGSTIDAIVAMFNISKK